MENKIPSVQEAPVVFFGTLNESFLYLTQSSGHRRQVHMLLPLKETVPQQPEPASVSLESFLFGTQGKL